MSVTWTSHPSICIEGNAPRLRVFKYLKTDRTLPKNLVDGKVVNSKNGMVTVEEYINSPDGMSGYRTSYGIVYDTSHKKQSVFSRFWKWLRTKFEKRELPPKTFADAKKMLEENVITNDIESVATKLKALVQKTYESRQVALAKRIENEHKNIINEIVLVKNGFFHYLTEDDVVKLLKTADFGIRIDFWNDYPEFVPDEVLEVKKKADALCVFDNWCVMHYDPKGEALKQIKEEEWRRDPILFGMIVGSDRLYFVKDWTTKTDDITIKKICDVLGMDKLREARNYGAKNDYSDYNCATDDLTMTTNEMG